MRAFGSNSWDWGILTVTLVGIICAGVVVYFKVQANYDAIIEQNKVIEQQMATSKERWLSNRELIQKLADESKQRDDKLAEETLLARGRWCSEATHLNPGWKCPE